MADHPYLRFLLRGDHQDLELALPFLFDAGCLGTEEIDSTQDAADQPSHWVAQRLYFPPSTNRDRLRREVSRHFPALEWIGEGELADTDWLRSWKEGWTGFSIGRHFYIRPSWEAEYPIERTVLWIDPERAFGTGTHDTTRLSLELVEEHAVAGFPAVDVGTGTGILAMAAARLGSRPVVAIEPDPDAAACALRNFRRNGLEQAIRLEVAHLPDLELEPAPLVVANIHGAVLRVLAPHLAGQVCPEGHLVLSGLLVAELDDLIQFLPPQWAVLNHRTAGGWAALVARRVG